MNRITRHVTYPTVAAKAKPVERPRRVVSPYRQWTAEEDAIVLEHYPHRETHEVAAMLGRTTESIRRRAIDKGIEKTAENVKRLRSRATFTAAAKSQPESDSWDGLGPGGA